VNATVLIIQNNGDHATKIKKEIFTTQGFDVLETATTKHGHKLITWEHPDIIIADVMLTDGCGLTFCKDLRGYSQIPVLFKCTRGTEDEIVQCLKAGGDGCLPKPYETQLTLAKVEALLRRTRHALKTATETAFAFGAISFSPAYQRAYFDGKDMLLRPKELALLRVLLLNENKALSPDALYEAVWGQPASGSRRALISCVSRLRRKIEGMGLGYGIEVERGVGYRLVK